MIATRSNIFVLERQNMPRNRIVLVTIGIMLSLFLASMESTVVATAMPTIVGQLGGLQHYSWVFSAYMLTSTTTVPLYGKLSDIYGRRRIYVIAMALFLTGSVMSGLAASMTQLIFARALHHMGDLSERDYLAYRRLFDLTVNSLPVVTANPNDVTVCAGSPTSFSVTATGTTLTYQWQEDSGGGFVNLANVAPYSNVTTATLNISDVTGLGGNRYRAVVSGTCAPAAMSSSPTSDSTGTGPKRRESIGGPKPAAAVTASSASASSRCSSSSRRLRI